MATQLSKRAHQAAAPPVSRDQPHPRTPSTTWEHTLRNRCQAVRRPLRHTEPSTTHLTPARLQLARQIACMRRYGKYVQKVRDRRGTLIRAIWAASSAKIVQSTAPKYAPMQYLCPVNR